MIERLVGRFWRWEAMRRDPDALVRCKNCEIELRRGDLQPDGACSLACSEAWLDRTAY